MLDWHPCQICYRLEIKLLLSYYYYKVNNHPMTKNKPIYHALESKPMIGLGETSPFHRFTNTRRDKSVYFWSWGTYSLLIYHIHIA